MMYCLGDRPACAQSKPLAGSLKCAPRPGMGPDLLSHQPHTPWVPHKGHLERSLQKSPSSTKHFLARQPQAPSLTLHRPNGSPRIPRWNFPPIIMCFQQSECLSDTYFGSNNYLFRLAWQTLLAVNPVSILPSSTSLAATKGRLPPKR